VPAVAIITDRFTETVRAIAAAHGMPGYRFVVIPHPIASNDDETLREKAETAEPGVVASLTAGAPPEDGAVGGAPGQE
jgi:hypothetical protein